VVVRAPDVGGAADRVVGPTPDVGGGGDRLDDEQPKIVLNTTTAAAISRNNLRGKPTARPPHRGEIATNMQG
jgi:hypothetical protein